MCANAPDAQALMLLMASATGATSRYFAVLHFVHPQPRGPFATAIHPRLQNARFRHDKVLYLAQAPGPPNGEARYARKKLLIQTDELTATPSSRPTGNDLDVTL